MISTLEEAQKHANHKHLKNVDFIFVLPDGHIYCFDLIDKAQKFLNENPECFVVKGKVEKVKVKKDTKETE